jgi:hypothetical protein
MPPYLEMNISDGSENYKSLIYEIPKRKRIHLNWFIEVNIAKINCPLE